MPRLSCSVSVRWKIAPLAARIAVVIRSATCWSVRARSEASSCAANLNANLARPSSARAPPPPGGDDENPAVRDHEVAVLIPRPDDAHVGATRGSYVHAMT